MTIWICSCCLKTKSECQCVGDTEVRISVDVEYWVNFFWEKNYKLKSGVCVICDDRGYFEPRYYLDRQYCFCPKGMHKRKTDYE